MVHKLGNQKEHGGQFGPVSHNFRMEITATPKGKYSSYTVSSYPKAKAI